MARADEKLISALRACAQKLENGAPYMWGHMGSCNCGHLAQELVKRTKAEIHAMALASRMGDWHEQTSAFCAESQLPMDFLISDLLSNGLSIEDLQALERLSDKQILARIPEENLPLQHNKREDVVLYMRTWAYFLEDQLIERVVPKKIDFEVLPTKVQ